jgi:ribonucleoside-diphosphate reductase beta chain
MTAFNNKQFDHTKQPMFFGEELSVARFDRMRYPKFDNLTEQAHGFFWRPSEVDVSKDRHDFNHKLSENDRRIFVSNLQYQILLDSVQGRSPVQILLPICSLPELEVWIETWSFGETIHSKSYTHIIRNVFNDPSEVFDEILTIPEIIERADSVTESYNELEQLTVDYKATGEVTDELRLALFKCMISVFALEAIRFYVSFACSFSFNERGLMEGNSKIIKLIARDEYLHQGATHFIITRWLKGVDDPEMTRIARDNKHLITEILKETAEQEMAWAKHLFQNGAVIGLNEKVLSTYVQFLTDECLTHFELPRLYNVTENPLPWMDKYTRSDNVQISPQETELSSYIVGGLDTKLDDFEFEL